MNLGDDLFLKILLERYPQICFRIIADKVYADILPYSNIQCIPPPLNSFAERGMMKISSILHEKLYHKMYVLLWKKFFQREVKKADAFLWIGGSVFMQYEDSYRARIKMEENIVTIFKHKKKYITGANFGPYSNDIFRSSFERIFSSYTDICFRDKKSYDLFPLLSNTRYAPDIVFQLKLPEVTPRVGTVGFSVMDFSAHDDLKQYSEPYSEIICKLINRHLMQKDKVTLISFCKEQGDEEIIERIIQSFPGNIRTGISVLKYTGNIDSFLREYSELTYMYATRFHSIVLSLSAKQKIYPFIYSEKAMHLLRDLHYTGKYSYIKDLGKTSVEEIFSGLINNSDFIIPDKIGNDAMAQFRELDIFAYEQ